jgi:hypothetical protein
VLHEAQSGSDTSVSESTFWNTLTMIALKIIHGFLRPTSTLFVSPLVTSLGSDSAVRSLHLQVLTSLYKKTQQLSLPSTSLLSDVFCKILLPR